MASTKYYDNLPTTGNEHGRAFRDLELEKELHEEACKLGLGAQFGGKWYALDVRVIRLPRHGASCRLAWESPALRTATRKPRSRRRASLLNSWKPTPASIFRKPCA